MKKVHFMGIGGSGMNAVAGIAHALGYEVSGCDLKESEYTADLVSKNIPIGYGHAAEHVYDQDLLCVSPAVFDLNSHHEEVVYAREHNIPIMTWQQFMGEVLQAGKRVISVTGTKGKTTTTALAGLLLEYAELDPMVEVGGTVREWNRNYRVGEGSFFVCEADEFNNNFLHFTSEIVILTNLEFDHPEFFKNYDEYLESYAQFIAKMPNGGVLIANSDSKGVADLLQKIDMPRLTVLTYGSTETVENRLISYKPNGQEARIVVKVGDTETEYVSSLIGEHNALNTLGVCVLANYLGIQESVVQKLLHEFSGVGRRFELICEKNDIKVFNDYAHNPMSVRAVLKAARDQYPNARIWAVFQPHLYSRTKMFLEEFALAFGDANEVVITDIYASREQGKPISEEVHSRDLVEKIHELNPSIDPVYVGDIQNAAEYVFERLESGDVVVNMGAGDNGIITELLCQKMQ